MRRAAGTTLAGLLISGLFVGAAVLLMMNGDDLTSSDKINMAGFLLAVALFVSSWVLSDQALAASGSTLSRRVDRRYDSTRRRLNEMQHHMEEYGDDQFKAMTYKMEMLDRSSRVVTGRLDEILANVRQSSGTS